MEPEGSLPQSQMPVPILSQINPVHGPPPSPQSHFLKISSLDTVTSDPDLYTLLTFEVPKYQSRSKAQVSRPVLAVWSC